VLDVSFSMLCRSSVRSRSASVLQGVTPGVSGEPGSTVYSRLGVGRCWFKMRDVVRLKRRWASL
jgi:hypothetical protein